MVREHLESYRALCLDDNEYKGDPQKLTEEIPFGCYISKDDCISVDEDGTLLRGEALTRYDPNTIDIKEWWSACRDSFPFLSVHGNPDSSPRSVEELKSKIHYDYNKTGTLEIIDLLVLQNIAKSVLEIGPGYGVICEYLKRYYKLDYWGLDVVRWFEHPQLIIGDGRGLTPELKANQFDVVLALNVLQHCTPEIRLKYYQDVYEVLKPGGKFLLSLNIYFDEEGDPSYAIRDEDNKYYTTFLGQYTRIDTFTEFGDAVWESGFRDNVLKQRFNNSNKTIAFVTILCTKGE